MITTQEIVDALHGRLLDLDPARTIVWPNTVPTSPAYPYLIVDVQPVAITDPTVKGTIEIHRGFAFVYVMDKRHSGEEQSLTVAEAVKALFPRGDRISTASGEVCITEPPQIMTGYTDKPHWRTPVKINYEAS